MEYVITIKHLQFIIEEKSKKPSSMTYGDREKLDPKTISTLRECLTNMIYFHVLQEKTTESIWKKLHDLCE
jgi:hypothetical protein